MMAGETSQCAGAQIPRWGPSAVAPGVFAGWQRHEADEIEYKAEDNGIIVLFTPSRLRETKIEGTVHEYAAAAGMVEIVPVGADRWARWHESKDTAHLAISPAKLDEIARLHFERDGAELFSRGIGFKDPVIFQIEIESR